MKNRIISLLLVLCMLLGAVPAVSAEETASTPKFTAYNLVLNESIAINFKLSGFDGNGFDRVEFWKDGKLAQTVEKLPAQVEGIRTFRFTKLSPDEMGKKITVKLIVNGETAAEASSSVKNYAIWVLNNPNQTNDIKTVIADMLNYGAAFQIFKKNDIEPAELVNADLTPEQRKYATQQEIELKSIQELGSQKDYPVKWDAFTLRLEDVVKIRYDIEAKDGADGLTMKLTVNGTTYEITDFGTPNAESVYTVIFDKLNPIQMKEAIDAQIFKGDVAVSSLFRTSIESYAANTNDAVVRNVVTQMMKYGAATEVWIENQEQAAAGGMIYVSAEAEAGKGDGSFENPYANIEEAKNAIRTMKADGKYPAGGVTVYFREGKYSVLETVQFQADDSGMEGAPVVYKAYNGEKVEFAGGISFDASEFKGISDPEILNRLADKANVKQVNLKSLGITDLGKMHVYGMAAGYFSTAGISIPTTPAPELFFEDEIMHISRYPNDGWLTIASVIETGDVIQNWTNSAHGNDYIKPEDRPSKNDITGSTFTVPRAVRGRMARWSQATDLWVYGFWKEDWSDQSMPVESIVPATGTVTTAIPSGKKITANRRFYFYNLLEEIDEAGEYYVDRDTGILYAYLPAETGTLTYGTLNGAVIQLKNVEHMQFEGIKFTAGRTNALEIRDCKNVVIKDLDISKFAKKAIILNDCEDVTVTGCHIYETGTGGINVGYTASKEPYKTARETLEPLGIVVENCEIHDFSRIAATYSAAIGTSGVGMVVRNCKIYNADHYAISLGGNDTLIENCEIFNVLRTVSDSGVLYCGFGKQEMGIVVRNNYVHDIVSSAGSDVSVVYMDDTKDGVTVESNLFVNVKGRGALINGGWNNNFRNNVLINVGTECTLGCIGMNLTDRYDLYKTGGNYQGLYNICTANYEAYEKYPDWTEKRDAYLAGTLVNSPYHNVIEDNVLINVSTNALNAVGERLPNWSKADSLRDNTVEAGHVYELNEIGFVDHANGDFTIKSDSVLYTEIPGFAAYDFSKIGLFDQSLEKPVGFGGSGYEGPKNDTIINTNFTITDPMFAEDFSGSDALNRWNLEASSGAITEIRNGTMVVSLAGAGTVQHSTGWEEEYIGRTIYEAEFKIERDGCDSLEADIFTVNGRSVLNAAGSLAELKVFTTEDGMFFGVSDGSGIKKTDFVCEDGRTYKITVVCDTVTNTYDFYADGEPVTVGRTLRDYAVSFFGFGMKYTNDSENTAPVLTYDNILVRPAQVTLHQDDFSDADALDRWSLAAPAETVTEIKNGALVVTYQGDGTVNHVARFEAFSGKVTYTLDYTLKTENCTAIDSGVFIVKGMNAAGSEKSLFNLEVDFPTKTFSAYDGGGGTRNAVAWEEGKTYKVVVICDADKDTYDFYVDDKPVIIGGKMRSDAGDVVSFTGICINQKSMVGENPSAVFTYDNICVITEAGAEDIVAPSVDGDDNTGNASGEIIETILVEDDFSVDLSKWNANSAAVIKDGQLEITAEPGKDIYYSLIQKLPTNQMLSVEFDLKLDGNTDTNFEAGILLKGKTADDTTDTAVNVAILKEKVQSQYGPTGAVCKNGVVHRIKIISNPETRTIDVYVNGKKVSSDKEYQRSVIAWDTVHFMIKGNNGTEPLYAYIDNFTVGKLKTLPTDNFSDGDASDWTYTMDEGCTATVKDGMLAISGVANNNTVNISKKFLPESGRIAIEWMYMLDQNGSKDMDSGITLKSGNETILKIAAKCPDDGAQYVFYACDGGAGEGSFANSGENAYTTKVCENVVPYRMKVVLDLDTGYYDLYIDGEKVIDGRRLMKDANTVDALDIFAESDTTGTAVVYFDDIDTKKTTERAAVLYEYAFTDEGGKLELTSGRMGYTMPKSFMGKVAIEYEMTMIPNGTGFKAKAYFQGIGSKTIANIGLCDGKVDVRGVSTSATYTANEKHIIKIVLNGTDKFDAYIDGEPIVSGREYHVADSGLLKAWFEVDSGSGTVQFDNWTIYKAG